VLGLTVLILLWCFPLPLVLATHVAGGGHSDNVNFLWNFWWMREALGSDERFFFTPYLFAPHGTDLTLHTHTALSAFAGATALGWLTPLAALNVTIVASLVLNAVCAYLLAWRITGDRAASTIAGLVFGASPYLAAHLNGHFNLTSAWTLPLFALAACSAMDSVGGPKRSARHALVAGMILGLTAYVDYYYVIYQIALLACAFGLAAGDWSLVRRGPTPRSLRAARVCAAIALVDVAVILFILSTGGFVATVAGVRILARDVFNPLQVLWVLLAAAAFLRWRPAVLRTPSPGWRVRAAVTQLFLVLAVSAIVAAPILFNGARVVLSGEYVSQQYFWRNAPKGIDLATLLLGNPFHGIWGSAIRASYDWLEIDVIESGGWLGIAPLILVAWAIRSQWGDRTVRWWTAIAGVFFVWSLGPHLRVFGVTTGMILPQTLLRFVPIAANARVPGRAIVVVTLAMAVLSAIAIARSQEPGRRRWLGVAAMGLIIMIDFMAAPFPVAAVDRPAIYEVLRDRPEQGAVLELPVGIRDSFTNRGFFDHRALPYQMIHGRPIVGGVVSRLSPSLTDAYAADPLVDALLKLSERDADLHALPGRALAGALLAKHGIAFIMLNREFAPPALIEYVEVELPITPVASEGNRALFVVRSMGVR
jgi:hypothetical protein